MRGTGGASVFTRGTRQVCGSGEINGRRKILLHCTVAWRASHLWAAYLIKDRGVAIEPALANARAINLMDTIAHGHRRTSASGRPFWHKRCQRLDIRRGEACSLVARPQKPAVPSRHSINFPMQTFVKRALAVGLLVVAPTLLASKQNISAATLPANAPFHLALSKAEPGKERHRCHQSQGDQTLVH